MAVIVLDGCGGCTTRRKTSILHHVMNENYEMPILPFRFNRGHLPRHLQALLARPRAEEAMVATLRQRRYLARITPGPGTVGEAFWASAATCTASLAIIAMYYDGREW